MEYYEFALTTPDISREALLNRLSEAGAKGFVEEPEKVIAYFDGTHDVNSMCAGLEEFRGVLQACGLEPAFSYSFALKPYEDWNEVWKRNYFSSVDVGKSFTVLPAWEKAKEMRTCIFIDPGMAFGTGHHETTMTCLSLLEQYSHLVLRRGFLDVGTGTGILAIGAALLGFSRVAAVDTDPLAVDAARRNAAINGIAHLEISQGDISAVEGTFTLIAANLIAETLCDMASLISARLAEQGLAVLSGMMPGQEDEVIAAMRRQGLILHEKIRGSQWVTLGMKKAL